MIWNWLKYQNSNSFLRQRKTNNWYRPFPSSFMPLFQSKSNCKTILMKMTLIFILKRRHKRTRKWPIENEQEQSWLTWNKLWPFFFQQLLDITQKRLPTTQAIIMSTTVQLATHSNKLRQFVLFKWKPWLKTFDFSKKF